MARWLCGFVALAAVVVLLNAPAGAEDDKVPSIAEIMKKAHAKNGLLGKLGTALKKEDTDWAAVHKDAAQLVKLGQALGKNDPPKGTAESWEKLTKGYVKTAEALVAAAEEKDKEAAVSSQKKLQGSCMGCHKQHKP